MILVVATPEHHASLSDEFASRYARDYDVQVVEGGPQAYALKGYLMSEGRQVALIAVDHSVEGGALPMLDKLRVASPTSRRVALVPAAGFAGCPRRAPAGSRPGPPRHLPDHPAGCRDEEFHTAISEYLSDWSWSATARSSPACRSSTTARRRAIPAIRDFLDRMGIAYERFHPDSDRARS